LNLRLYTQPSRIKEQFGPSLDELQAHGYLAGWSLERTSDRKGYKLVLLHGQKFHRDRQRHLPERTETDGLGDRPEPVAQAVGQRDAVDEDLVRELTRRGVSENQARRILRGIPARQDVRAQLEWGDSLVRQNPDKYRNPPGLYVSLIRDNILPSYAATAGHRGDSHKTVAPEGAQGKTSPTSLQQLYEDYLRRRTTTYIATLDPVVYDRRLSGKVGELAKRSESFSKWSDEARRKIAKAALYRELQKELPLLSFGAFCEHTTRFSSKLASPPVDSTE
jgi:hypothetical protein